MSIYRGSEPPENDSETEPITNVWGEIMGEVTPLKKPDRPIRKCPNCSLVTSLMHCPSTVCNNKKTVVMEDGRL